jgi:hypothetical protein
VRSEKALRHSISRRKCNCLTGPPFRESVPLPFFRSASISVDAGLGLSHCRDQVFVELPSRANNGPTSSVHRIPVA